MCGSFTQNKLVSSSNSKMGPHDDCNDINLKFERDYTCENNQTIINMDATEDIRCDCPVVENENAFGTNCKLNRLYDEKWLRLLRIVVPICLCLIGLTAFYFVLKWCCFTSDVESMGVDDDTLYRVNQTGVNLSSDD